MNDTLCYQASGSLETRVSVSNLSKPMVVRSGEELRVGKQQLLDTKTDHKAGHALDGWDEYTGLAYCYPGLCLLSLSFAH